MARTMTSGRDSTPVRAEELQSLAKAPYLAGLVEQRESVRALGSFKERCNLRNVDLLHAALAYLGGVVGDHGDEVVAAEAGQQGAEGVWKIKIGEENGRVDGEAASNRLMKFLRNRRGAPPRTLTNPDEDAA